MPWPGCLTSLCYHLFHADFAFGHHVSWGGSFPGEVPRTSVLEGSEPGVLPKCLP